MTPHEERKQVISLVSESMLAGARQSQVCKIVGLSERTLQRWQTGDVVQSDKRPQRLYQPTNKLTDRERAHVLAVANSEEYGHLPPSQIVPRLADQGHYLASESTFYRLLRAANQLTHRRGEHPAKSRTKPRAICATAPTCPLRAVDGFSISICLSIFLVEKLSGGKCMKKKVVL